MNIASYRVLLFNREMSYGRLGKCWTTAQIGLTSDPAGREYEGILIFYDPDKTDAVPENILEGNDAGEKAHIFVPRHQYVAHVDLLRNEHPVFLSRASIRTIWEKGGEGDY